MASLVVGFISCATPIPEGSVVVARTQLQELERRGVEIKRCRVRLGQAGRAHERTQRALTTTKAELHLLQSRLGSGSFQPQTLTAGGANWQLALPQVQQVASHGDKPRRISLAKLLRGRRATVLSYWATWCKPCTSPDELAALQTLAEQLHPYNAGLLTLAVDGLDAVTSDARAPTWHYPLLQRNNGHLETLPQALVQSTGLGLPLFVVLDGSGRVRWLHKGKLDDAVIAELVTAAARVPL